MLRIYSRLRKGEDLLVWKRRKTLTMVVICFSANVCQCNIAYSIVHVQLCFKSFFINYYISFLLAGSVIPLWFIANVFKLLHERLGLHFVLVAFWYCSPNACNQHKNICFSSNDIWTNHNYWKTQICFHSMRQFENLHVPPLGQIIINIF